MSEIPGTSDWWHSANLWYCSLSLSYRFGGQYRGSVSGAGATKLDAFRDAMVSAKKKIAKMSTSETGAEHDKSV
jgi:hypothetical protein